MGQGAVLTPKVDVGSLLMAAISRPAHFSRAMK